MQIKIKKEEACLTEYKEYSFLRFCVFLLIKRKKPTGIQTNN